MGILRPHPAFPECVPMPLPPKGQLYVPSYDEDQVALVVAEDSNFLRRCQVIIGTPTINRAVWAMKESEMENAPEAWQSAQHTYKFANYTVQLNFGGLRHDYAYQYGQEPNRLRRTSSPEK